MGVSNGSAKEVEVLCKVSPENNGTVDRPGSEERERGTLFIRWYNCPISFLYCVSISSLVFFV